MESKFSKYLEDFEDGAEKILKQIKWYSQDDILMTVNQAGIEAEDHFEISTEMVELNQ